jgi:hypothetical protein
MMHMTTNPVLYLALASLLACTILVSSGSVVARPAAFVQRALTPPATMIGNVPLQNVNNKPSSLVGFGLRLHGRQSLGRYGKASFPPIQSTFMAAPGTGPTKNDEGSFSSSSTPELKKLLKDKGMSTAGSRAEMIQRLKGPQNADTPSDSSPGDAGKAVKGFGSANQGFSKEKPVQGGFGSKKPSEAGKPSKGFTKPSSGFANDKPVQGFGSNKADQGKDKMNSSPSATSDVTTAGSLNLRESSESPPVASVQDMPSPATDQVLAAAGGESGGPSNSMKLASKDDTETCAQPSPSSSAEGKITEQKTAEQGKLASNAKSQDKKSGDDAQIVGRERVDAEWRAAQKKTEEDRIAAGKKVEQDKMAAEAAEKKAEGEWSAAEKKSEENRISALRAEEEKKAAAKRLEDERVAAAKKIEEEWIVAQKVEKEKRSSPGQVCTHVFHSAFMPVCIYSSMHVRNYACIMHVFTGMCGYVDVCILVSHALRLLYASHARRHAFLTS